MHSASLLPIRNLLVACFLVFLFSSCELISPEPEPPGQGSIELGEATMLAQGSVGPSGGTIEVTGQSTLNGLKIDVPSGALPDARTLSVSFLPIKSFKNINSLNPVTPMIRISNGGGFAGKPMEVTIPIDIPSDHFALAFAYRAETGELEGLPIIDQTSKSIVIATRHFEHSQIMDPNLSAVRPKGGIVQETRAETDLLVSTIPKHELLSRSYLTTFKPGQDDWKFPNYGSILEPKGHCAGQSLGMMYYYNIQKTHKGQPSLYGRYDNDGQFATPKIWLDDRSAYSFCSVLQNYYDSWNFEVKTPVSDIFTFMAFKYAMIVTERPQLVGILTADGTSGHAMVIYGADDKTLFVTDPNYPGKSDRTITFTGLKFDPYMSGDNAKTLGTPYPVIMYTGLTSYFNWQIAHKEWPLVENHTAGTRFLPSFVIKAKDTASGEYKPISSAWKSTTGKGYFMVESSANLTIQAIMYPDSSILQVADEFDDYYDLFDGRRWVGFYITSNTGDWAGFKWIEIEGKLGPPPTRCETTKSWETALGSANVIYTDSLAATGERRVILEDAGSPEDICTDEHIHPKWEVRGPLAGFTITASSYWGLYGRDAEMKETSPEVYEATMEIGLKQAFDKDPGWIGLQTEFKFRSRGDLDVDLKYLFDRLRAAKISMTYKEHR